MGINAVKTIKLGKGQGVRRGSVLERVAQGGLAEKGAI